MFGFDLIEIIKAAGYIGLFGIIFAESGLLIGFFLPGDSLLFTAGFLASQGLLNIWVLVPLLFFAAVIGDSVGYSFGYRVGPRIFNRKDSILFNKEHLHRANKFFERYGGKTIILARFMPIIRTFVPILAGVGTMHYRTFLFYNIVGAFLWAVGITLLGFFLGKAIPDVDKYLLPIIVVIILSSFAPSIYQLLKSKEDRRRMIGYIQRIFKRS
jgi:membrane-associated protein